MLRQEINLYRTLEQPAPAANFLTWKRFTHTQIFAVIVLFIAYLYANWNVYSLGTQKTGLQLNVNALQSQFIDVKKDYPPLFFSQDVNQSVGALQQELDTESRILQSLATPIPFSINLITFSNLIVPNVWLTQINLEENGNQITLKGRSTSLNSIQTFFSNLTHEKLFANFVINIDDIARPDANTNNILSFQVSIKKKSL